MKQGSIEAQHAADMVTAGDGQSGAKAPRHRKAKARSRTGAVSSTGERSQGRPRTGPTAGDAGPEEAQASGQPIGPGCQTKQSLLIALLQRPEGATIAELTEATGWQSHSVRGAISFALKKKFGMTIASAPEEGRGRVYRVPGPTKSAAKASRASRRSRT